MKKVLERNILEEKNKIVVSLRDYLMRWYGTKHHYTSGEGDFEVKKSHMGYGLVRRDPTEPRDLTGFRFRKDLCSHFWSTDKEKAKIRVCEDIHRFLQEENIESKLEMDSRGSPLSLKIGNKKYFVHVYVGEGYADEIHVSFYTLT